MKISVFISLPHDVQLRHLSTRYYQSGLVQSEYEVLSTEILDRLCCLGFFRRSFLPRHKNTIHEETRNSYELNHGC
jgi:hypothetical protein